MINIFTSYIILYGITIQYIKKHSLKVKYLQHFFKLNKYLIYK